MKTVSDAVMSLHLGKQFFREVCGMTVNDRAISIRTDNSSGDVEFDFFAAMQKVIFEKQKNLTMVHTHPTGVNGMSLTDINMSTAWPLGLGIPIRYVILTKELYMEYRLERVENKTVRSKIHEYPFHAMSDYCEGHFVAFCRTIYGLSVTLDEFDGEAICADFNDTLFGE